MLVNYEMMVSKVMHGGRKGSNTSKQDDNIVS